MTGNPASVPARSFPREKREERCTMVRRDLYENPRIKSKPPAFWVWWTPPTVADARAALGKAPRRRR